MPRGQVIQLQEVMHRLGEWWKQSVYIYPALQSGFFSGPIHCAVSIIRWLLRQDRAWSRVVRTGQRIGTVRDSDFMFQENFTEEAMAFRTKWWADVGRERASEGRYMHCLVGGKGAVGGFAPPICWTLKNDPMDFA